MKRLFQLVVVGLSLACVFSAEAQQTSDDVLKQFQKLTRFYRYLNGMYVDSVAMAPHVERAIESMLEELDPHSSYIPAEEMRGVQEQFDGEFSGIGVEFNVYRDTVRVVNVIAGAPAERVGVRANDRIVTIDGADAVGMKRSDVPKKLRGKTGSKVTVGIKRHGSDEITDYVITRDKIPLNTLDAAYRIGDSVGYFKINRFGRTTMREFEAAFDRLDGINSIILDLRGNGGGIFEQAIELANFFLPAGRSIVSTEGRVVQPQYYSTRRNGKFVDGKVVVLLDESSASASEIVAGALQDWDRAVIIGRPSFGKGLVQRQMMLDDSSAVRITIARYHTPTGRVIQRPYENGKRDEYYKAYRNRFTDMEKADTLNSDRPIYKTLLSGRTVYGGGGITPDITVVQDTTEYTDYLVKLISRGIVAEYLSDYLDARRDELKAKYLSFEEFDGGYDVDDDMISALATSGVSRGVAADTDGLSRSNNYLKRYIKAYTARNLFSVSDFYRVFNSSGDNVYDKAIEVISDGTTYRNALSPVEKSGR